MPKKEEQQKKSRSKQESDASPSKDSFNDGASVPESSPPSRGQAPDIRDQDLTEELSKIYTDKKGDLPDFTRLEGKPTSRLKSAAVGLFFFLVVLAGVTWAGLFYFSDQGGGFTGDRVETAIETDDTLTAGADAEIVLRYRNRENVPLASAVLSADLPEGFVLEEAEPGPNEDGEWPLGSVAPGAEGTVRLKGWIRAEIDDALTFQTTLDYKPADFSSRFEKIGSHTVVVEDSVLEVEASGPEKMTPGDEIELTYILRNTGSRGHEDLRFRFDPPEGFLFDSAEPAPDTEDGREWTIASLAPAPDSATSTEEVAEDTETPPANETTVTIRGSFASGSRGPKTIPGQLGFAAENGFVSLAENGVETEVLKSDLALGLIINGTSKDTTFSFGELLNVTIAYRNEGDVDLHDVELSFELPSDPDGVVDWVTLNDDLDGERVGPVITWSSDEIEGLDRLEPGDEGVIDLSMRLSKDPVEGAETTDYRLDAKVSASIGQVGRFAGSREVASSPLVIRLNSDTVYRAFGRYFTEDGVPLGSGPLPPKISETTVYRVFWVIENSLHELTNLSMETVLPQGVKWTGEERPVEAGSLTFDESGRRATWRLNRMPTSVERLIVTFDVALTPEFEDVGRIVDLTGDNRFEALDKETGSVILITEPPVDTSLPADDEAAGKGTVQQ